MFNFIKNMKIRTAVIAVAILPLMSSFIYSAHSVYSDLQTVSELESLGRLTKLTIKMNELVHEVQLERGVSSIYLGSKGKTFAKELLEERKATNTKRTEFIDLIKRSDIKEYGDQFSGGIDSLIKDLTRLDSIRERVDHFTISIPEEVEYFSNLNAQSMDIISKMALMSSSSEITTRIIVYVNFMRAKEFAGMERATASGAFGQGIFSQSAKDRVKHLITAQEVYLKLFRGLATADEVDFFDLTMSDKAVTEVDRMREEFILTNDSVSAKGSQRDLTEFAVDWFDNITAKINLMKKVENNLADNLEAGMEKTLAYTKQKTAAATALHLLSTLLALLIFFLITRSINRSFSEVLTSMKGLAAGVTSTLIPGETRNEMGEMTKALHIFKDNKIKADELAALIEKQREVEIGLNKLAEVLRDHEDMNILSDQIVHLLSQYLDVQVVALYVLGEGEIYICKARYGYPKQGCIDQFGHQDGSLGQAVLDATPITVKNIPSYAHLTLGLGVVPIDSLLIFPLVHDGVVVAVIEMGSLRPFDEEKLAWLEKAKSGLAITIRMTLDLEQRTLAEKELARAKDDAEAANKTKSAFLANMSHELRTPMNAIIGYSEMLMEEAEDVGQEGFIPDLKKINQAGNHLLSLINSVLDLSKIESGRMEAYAENFEIDGLIDMVSGTAQPLMAKNNNHFEIKRGPDLGNAFQDVTKLRQALLNLISNAAKFTHDGTITLTVNREINDGVDWLVLSVSDTGIGIPSDKLEYVFEEFSQADSSTTRNYGGTGLGLAISRRFCQMLGGDITVTSQIGTGSVFTINLPAILPGTESQTPHEIPSTLPDDGHNNLRIEDRANTVLVIDDDAGACEIIKRLLEKDGFNVVVAHTGQDGLRIAHEMPLVAITLDVTMNGLDGWSVLSVLKADPKLKDIPVVMLTGIDDKGKGYSLGATDYLIKPVSREQLNNALQKFYTPSRISSVLLIEDDLPTRSVMARTLEKMDWTVYEAGNGQEGLERLEQHKPDLILLDLMMPVMDGFEFLIKMRSKPDWIDIPVMVLTAKDLTPEDRNILKDKVSVVVEKGKSDYEEVAKMIRQVVDSPPSQTH